MTEMPSQVAVASDDQSTASARLPFLRRVRSGDTFLFLFVLLLADFAVTVIGSDTPVGRMGGAVLSAATLLLALLAAKASRGWVVLGALSLVGSVVVAAIGEASGGIVLQPTVNGIHMVILVACIPIILRRLVHHETVTGETVAGSLCVYLLIGMAFANVYLLLSALPGGSVLAVTTDVAGSVERGDYFYYSFVSMLTIGFGDVVPRTDLAKALVVLQTITGQVFLLTMVARLVSVATVRRRPRR